MSESAIAPVSDEKPSTHAKSTKPLIQMLDAEDEAVVPDKQTADVDSQSN